MKKIKILSYDTETLGLEDPFNSVNQIIEFAMVAATVTIDKDDINLEIFPTTFRRVIKCPSFDVLKPNLTPWVMEHNKTLIDEAHLKGISDEDFKDDLDDYLTYVTIDLFDTEPILYLGKSMQSLDAPLLHKHLGWDFIQRWKINRNKIDIQDITRFLIQQDKLPIKSASSKSLVEFFGIKDDVNHTAIEDSIDMLKIYCKLLKY